MMPSTTGFTESNKLWIQTCMKLLTLKLKSQPILHGDKIRYKKDSIVADETVAVKLVLWEDTTDKSMLVNQIQNCKIRVFDDSKFLNTNEFTKIIEIDEIPIINLATLELQDNIINGQCLGVDLKCTTTCICCNKTTDETNDETNIVTCLNCSMTLIKDVFSTKVVTKLLMKIDEKLVNYTAFSDAIQSFMSNINCKTSLSKMTSADLSKLFFIAGKQKLILDQSTRAISQFLPSTSALLMRLDHSAYCRVYLAS